MKTFALTALGTPIFSYNFGLTGKKILILGGVHGDEVEGVYAARGLMNYFLDSFAYKLNITVIPEFNPDGVLNKTRTNSSGVDLNRNLPTKDWSPEIKTVRYHPGPSANSELENQALVKYLEKEKPHFILSLHSWNPMLNINGDCKTFAEVVSSRTGYIIDEDIGYPTPGCLGTFTGKERGIPTLTYEIERGLDAKSIQGVHVPAILEALKVFED